MYGISLDILGSTCEGEFVELDRPFPRLEFSAEECLGSSFSSDDIVLFFLLLIMFIFFIDIFFFLLLLLLLLRFDIVDFLLILDTLLDRPLLGGDGDSLVAPLPDFEPPLFIVDFSFGVGGDVFLVAPL